MCNSGAPTGAAHGDMLERLTGGQGIHTASTHADFRIQAASPAARFNTVLLTAASLNNLMGTGSISAQDAAWVIRTAKTRSSTLPNMTRRVRTAATPSYDLQMIFRLPAKSYSP